MAKSTKVSTKKNIIKAKSYERQNASDLKSIDSNDLKRNIDELLSDSESESSDCEAPLVATTGKKLSTKIEGKTDGEELLEDLDLHEVIKEGLGRSKNVNKRKNCIPGVEASSRCGPQLVQCDGCGPKMGFNPLFYLICFLVFGVSVLFVQYKKEMGA